MVTSDTRLGKIGGPRCRNIRPATPELWRFKMLSQDTTRRFWRKVNKNGPVPAHRPELGPCWVWTGHVNNQGYGAYSIPNNHGYSNVRPHRIAFSLAYGGIPSDKPYICHACDNRRCCNPSHLFAGTQKDNIRDAVAKQRLKPCGLKWKRGEACAFSKHTDADILAIRARFDAGESQASILLDYPGSQSNLSSICRGKGWRHLL